MILSAVIVGYILGVVPFIFPKTIEFIKTRTKAVEDAKENKEQKEIFDEWLNGPKKEINQNSNEINQADIYNEYITGKETVKGA